MKQRLLVIGNGMAGMQMVESLLQRAPQRFAITVIGREPHGNYNRVLLSPVLAGETPFSETLIHDRDWYERHGVTLLSGETVLQVDLSARTVQTDIASWAGIGWCLPPVHSPVCPPFPASTRIAYWVFAVSPTSGNSWRARDRWWCWAVVFSALKRRRHSVPVGVRLRWFITNPGCWIASWMQRRASCC